MKHKAYFLIMAVLWLVPPSGHAAVPVDADDFEQDAVVSLPTKPTVVAPLVPVTGASLQVVDDAANIAGSGKGLRLQDNNSGTSVGVQYEFTRIADAPPDASIPNGLIPAVRVDLSFAPLSTTGTKNDYLSITLGEFGADLTLPSKRFIDCQLWDNGTIDFISGPGVDSTGHSVLAASNTLSIYANDNDSQITYTGPDDNSYILPADKVAYWLNGIRIAFGGQGYTSLENQSTANGAIFTSTINIGRFGIVSSGANVGLDYVFDDIRVTDLDSEQMPTSTSWLVQSSPTGLVYAGYANEGQANEVNTVPDFSHAGYKGGGVPIPFVPAVVILSDDGPGDDTTRIQNAINQVSALSVGPDGFRGAVVLEAGEYTVSSTLTISAGGVVIRGAGSQESGGTRITYTATTQTSAFDVASGGSAPTEIGGTRVAITDSFVPVGARSFQVSNASGYAPGNQIMVQNTVNQQWLLDMSDMTQYGWNTSTYQLKFRRMVTAVDGNTITIDAPIVQTLEDQYGGGDIYKYTYTGELENIGFENLRLESSYASDTDENHGKTAIFIRKLKNGWVRQITARYFYGGLLNIFEASSQITVEDCAMLDYKGTTSSGNRYTFHLDESHNILVQRCLTRGGRHDFVSGSRTHGPNVFTDCRSTETYNDIGPHQRYSTGQLYDNLMGGEMNVQNRTTSGSGHGWSGAQVMFWNCDAASIVCDAPNGAMNWCIGSTSVKNESWRSPSEPFGIWDSLNNAVTPRSLYYAQLEDRLGMNALNKVILPQQKAGNVWSELFLWDGDGVFLNDVVVWVDGEALVESNVPVAIGGVVRKLVMLDRGVTYTWSKVSGPGTMAFGDDTAPETTATFSQEGLYVLELSVDDGVSPVSNTVTIQVGEGSSDTTPPVAPTNLVATPGDGFVILDWDDNAEADLAGYSVYRSTNSGSYGSALATNLNSSAYVDNTASNGITYYYVVSAADINTNESAQSVEVSAIPQVDTAPPAAPTGLAAVAGDNRLTLNWDDNGELDLASYGVYRSDTPENYGAALATGLSSSDYVDDAVVNGATYYYKVTAVDINANESAKSDEVSATPEAPPAPSDVVLFGSNNEGYAGFTTTPGSATEIWTENTESVQYRNQDAGQVNSSLLGAFTLDRSDGRSYTIEGVVELTDGYADDNNRVGIYLFGDSSALSDQLEAGALSVIFNTDDSSAAGSPGDNASDYVQLREGVDSTPILAQSLRDQTTPYAQDLFGTVITIGADLVFYNDGADDRIQIDAYMIAAGDTTTLPGVSVLAADYTGDYFGFVTRARARNYPTDPTPTAAERSLPWVMDYKSFRVTDNSAPALEGYDLWATQWGTNNIGGTTLDYESDGLVNWVEYALGGNPVSNDVADILPEWSIGADGGSNWLYYTYNRRDDAAARGLSYTVWTGTNLVDGLSNAVPVWSTAPATNGFEAATHRISSDAAPNAFMKLEIELSE